MRRGEVRWYRFPAPDKRRPVVVLTRDPAIGFLNEVVIAPVTSRIRGIPSEVPLGRGDGMPHPCAVNLDHLYTVSKGRIEGLVAALSPARMAEIRTALLFALGF